MWPRYGVSGNKVHYQINISVSTQCLEIEMGSLKIRRKYLLNCRTH